MLELNLMLLQSTLNLEAPLYPDFKKVSLSDRDLITNFTDKFPFHSDFSFENLHLWGKGIESESEYCFLNNNLVIHFRNNHADGKSVSLLGGENLDKSISILLKDFPSIDYVVPDVAEKINHEVFNISEDRENFGYVVSLPEVVDTEGKPKIKNHDINRFRNRYPDVQIKRLNLDEELIRKEIINLYKNWAESKGGFASDSIQCEFDSLNRFFSNYKEYKYIAIGAYDADLLIGFNIALLSTHKTMLGFDCKTIGDYKNLYAYLLYVMAYIGLQKGYVYFDFDVDLGIEGLRKAKLSWNPDLYKKLKVIAK